MPRFHDLGKRASVSIFEAESLLRIYILWLIFEEKN